MSSILFASKAIWQKIDYLTNNIHFVLGCKTMLQYKRKKNMLCCIDRDWLDWSFECTTKRPHTMYLYMFIKEANNTKNYTHAQFKQWIKRTISTFIFLRYSIFFLLLFWFVCLAHLLVADNDNHDIQLFLWRNFYF